MRGLEVVEYCYLYNKIMLKEMVLGHFCKTAGSLCRTRVPHQRMSDISD